jgi:hypothetical protein
MKGGQEAERPSAIMGSIHMWLDSYDDIFSDFDPSPYSQRLLSEDFLSEAKRRYAETKKGKLELRFSLPAKMRDQKTEALIKRRLKQYFQMKAKEGEGEVRKSRVRGAVYFVLGFLVLLSVAIVPPFVGDYGRFLEILLVPVGWFGMFDGVELMVESPRSFEKEINFSRRLADASYEFFSEEELMKKIVKEAKKH